MRRRRTLSFIAHLIILIATLAFQRVVPLSYLGLAPPSASAARPPEPTYGKAVVDGDPSEWIGVGDLFADMYQDGMDANKVTSKLNLRYDYATQTMYVLVLGGPGAIVVQSDRSSPGDAYVRINGERVVDGSAAGGFRVFLPVILNGDGTGSGAPVIGGDEFSAIQSSATQFAFINERTQADSGHTVADGWEASFPLSDGNYMIDAHTSVYDQQEHSSAVANRGVPLLLVKPSVTIGDLVWEDLDQDGIQDAGEPGIASATVKLYRCADDSLAASTTSDANGRYSFMVSADTYYVQFVAPSGYTFSSADQGPDDSIDSDADRSTGRTICIILEDNEVDLNWDAGLYRGPSSIGDRVWEDLDGDGLQDASEPGLVGVTVRLYGCDGTLAASASTDASGTYSLSVSPGDYYVRVTAPNGYVFSPQDQGTNDGVDSDADASGQTDCTTLEPGETDLTWDAGLNRSAALGDFVWQDLDADGTQDAGESGIPGVTVRLYACGGTSPVATTSTNSSGYYLFEDLRPGCYVVEFAAPGGYIFSPRDQGTDNGQDSDASPSTGRTVQFNLHSGGSDMTWDAGLYRRRANIGDLVWNDLDDDGVQDPGEPGIPGVTVQLRDCNEDSLVASTTTDASGEYSLTPMPGNYYVQFAAPDGYAFSPRDQGADDGRDSDVNPDTGRTMCTTLSPGETDLSWDAGLKAVTCDLSVSKTCQVAIEPKRFDCSDGKPINELTMTWDGTQAVSVRAWKGSVGSTIVGEVENVAPGDEITISGFAGSPNDVYWEIFAASTGTKIGESTFHLSCSDPDMNGPEDCAKREGDGKDKAGYLNDWRLEGMAGNDQVLDCTPTPPAPSDTCELTLGQVPSCETQGKPTSLTFKYTGGGCAASNNPQGGKATCSGSIDPNLPVSVSSSNSGYTINPASVAPGAEFTVSASSFNSDSFFALSNAGGTEQLKIHTSCSQILAVDDVYGSLTLVAFSDHRAGDEVTYSYAVTNNGTPLTNVSLTDNPLGPIAGPFELAAGETRSFQTVAQIQETVTNIGTFSGVLTDGATCSARDTATVTVNEPCAECAGGVTELTLRYNGDSASFIQVYEGKDARPDKLLFSGTVQPGETFNFTGIRSDHTMSSEIGLFVGGVRNTVIHTSCSKPIGPGLVSGDFEVVEGRSKDAGLMCPLGNLPLCELGKPQVLAMEYLGDSCTATSHSQDPSKVTCTDYGILPSSVHIRASDKSNPYDGGAKVWFQGPVELNGTLDIAATAAAENHLASDTYVHVFNSASSALVQQVKFHTSCSQPLFMGDQFGSVKVVGFTPE